MSKPVEIMSITDVLAWSPPDDRLWQLVDGKPCAMAPANRSHGAIQAELGRLLASQLLEVGSPCSVVVTLAVIPIAKADVNVRIPDLGITCSPYEVEERAHSRSRCC